MPASVVGAEGVRTRWGSATRATARPVTAAIPTPMSTLTQTGHFPRSSLRFFSATRLTLEAARSCSNRLMVLVLFSICTFKAFISAASRLGEIFTPSLDGSFKVSWAARSMASSGTWPVSML